MNKKIVEDAKKVVRRRRQMQRAWGVVGRCRRRCRRQTLPRTKRDTQMAD